MAKIIHINGISGEELSPYKSLKGAKQIGDESVFIAEGVKVIELALDNGVEPVSFLMEERQIEGIGKNIIARCPDTPVFTASRETLASITGFELTRGLLSVMKAPKFKTLDEALNGAKKIAVLERLSDAMNVGAIFRSAAALGIDAVLLFHNCSGPLNRRTVRVSMGSVFLVPWAFFEKDRFETGADAVKFLEEKGFKTAALALEDDSISIDDKVLKSSEKLALFLGSEGEGLSEETITECDYTVKIPMFSGVDSLNVAAAAAVSFWEIAK